MKRLLAFVVVAGLASMTTLRAADEPRPERTGAAKVPAGPGAEGAARTAEVSNIAEGPAIASSLECLNKILGLTDAQKKTIAAILDARQKAIEKFYAANRENLAAARAAAAGAEQDYCQGPGAILVAAKEEACIKTSEELDALYLPAEEVMGKAQAEMDKALTAAQLDKIRQVRLSWAMNVVRATAGPVRLADGQIEQLRIRTVEGLPGFEGNGNYNRLVQDVLTPEQKATIVKRQLTAYAQGLSTFLKFTDEQSNKAAAAADEMSKDANAGCRASYSKFWARIEPVLTAEQKEVMEWKPKYSTGPFNKSDGPARAVRTGAVLQSPRPQQPGPNQPAGGAP